ncbi:MAG: hypothetical protein IJC35_03510 [Oscillospiraceae bacterium]|nr:hypothetical protein [Oscillospiraceae bacterium]
METDINRFRGMFFGGFNRRDVADYIELLAAERNRLQVKAEELEGRVKRLQGENATVRSFAEGERRAAEDTRRTLEAEYAQKQAELEADFREKEEALRQDFAAKEAAMRQENEELRRKYEEEIAQRVLRELEAVMPLLDGIAADTAADAEELRSRMEYLCDGLETSASAAAEVCRRIEELQQQLRGEETSQG